MKSVPWTLETQNPGMSIAMLHDCGMSPCLDTELAAMLSDVLSGGMLRSINNMKEQMALEGKLMRGFSLRSTSTLDVREKG